MSSKGRNELQISVSGAKNCEEPAGDVRFGVAPQKPGKNAENSIKFQKKIAWASKNETSGIV